MTTEERIEELGRRIAELEQSRSAWAETRRAVANLNNENAKLRHRVEELEKELEAVWDRHEG